MQKKCKKKSNKKNSTNIFNFFQTNIFFSTKIFFVKNKFGHFFVTDTHTAPIIYKSLFGTSSTVFIRTLSRWGPMCDNNEAFEEEKAKDEESDSA